MCTRERARCSEERSNSRAGFIGALSRENFADGGGDCARDLFTSASRRPARKPGLSDETRAQIAIKTFRFYSRTRPRGRLREIEPPEKADGLLEGGRMGGGGGSDDEIKDRCSLDVAKYALDSISECVKRADWART